MIKDSVKIIYNTYKPTNKKDLFDNTYYYPIKQTKKLDVKYDNYSLTDDSLLIIKNYIDLLINKNKVYWNANQHKGVAFFKSISTTPIIGVENKKDEIVTTLKSPSYELTIDKNSTTLTKRV